MKKIISFLLATVMVLSLIPVGALTLFADANTDKTGLTFNGDGTYGAEDEYYAAKSFDEVPLTFSAWVYLDYEVYNQRGVIIGNYPGAECYTGYVNFEMYNHGVPRLVIGDWNFDSGELETHAFQFTKAVVPYEDWTNITCVVDPETEAVHCYINGKLKQSITEDFVIPHVTVKDYPYMLGGDQRMGATASNGLYFKGELGNVSVYSDARTADEVARDYQNGADLTNADLICAYDVDASDKGKDIADLSGNGYNMLYNKVWLTEAEMEARRSDTSNRAYAFAVISDTQYSTEFNLGTLEPIYDWIVANKESKNIQYVMGVGDITNTDTNIAGSADNGPYEWQAAYNAISKLNGVVPYSLVRGNHDVYSSEAGNGVVSLKGQGFIEYFGGDDDFYAQQFKNPQGYEAGYYEGELANYKGIVETDSVANSWRTLELDGDKWLLINIDWGAHDSVLAWAGEVIEAHPTHRVIITTHCYLASNGDHADSRLDGAVINSYLQKGFNNGDGVWEKLTSRYTNIEMVICGHQAAKTIVVKQDLGVYNNTVTQILVDGQTLDRYWGGLGLVALLYVSKDGKSVDIEYYSTVKGKYFGSVSQRTVDLTAEGTAPSTAWDSGSSFAPVGSGTEADPYLITCAENLRWMAKACAYVKDGKVNPFEGKYFKQTCDIDLNGKPFLQIGSYYKSSAYAVFGGVYDGQGYRIYNGYIKDHSNASQNENWGVGLFGYVYSSDGTARVMNVVADNITASGITAVGIIAGKTYNAQILNCVVTDTCKVVGTGTKQGVSSSTSVINNKSPQWNMYTQNRLGGIVGHAANNGHIYYCVSSATIHTNGNNAFAGGIVGSIGSTPNIRYKTFDGKIINDFTDTEYFREIEGENVNGGIIGYMGSGSGSAFVVSGNRWHTNNTNKGSFEIRGTATTDVVYGGILGAAKGLGATSHHLENNYNLSNDISLGTQPESITVYVAGLVGRATVGTGETVTLNVTGYSVDLPDIKNGGLNVDTAVYTTGVLYNETTVASGTKAVTSTASVKTQGEILEKTDPMEDEYAAKRAEGLDTDILEVIGYQKALAEEDERVRLIFGSNNELTDLHRYVFETTVSYNDAAGDTVTERSVINCYDAYTSFNGKDESGNDKDYAVGVDYTYKYLATLVIDPTLNGKVEGGATVTVTAFTVDKDGYRHGYITDMITLTFDGEGGVTVS